MSLSCDIKTPKLYTENYSFDIEQCLINRYITCEVGVQTVENAIILPLIRDPDTPYLYSWKGGVCDKDFNFIAGVTRKRGGYTDRSVSGSYSVKDDELTKSNESVLFLGWIDYAFGHLISEGMSRFWYLAHHSGYKGKIAFVMLEKGDMLPYYYELLSFFGVSKEQVIIVEKPTIFANVIIPDQTMFTFDGYTDYCLDAFEHIKKCVKKADYKKVYFTRKFLPKQDTVNEEYFEKFFSSQGYKVVAPEKLTLYEQLSILSGVKEIACIQGTLSHLALFAENEIKLTVLTRAQGGVHPLQILINQAKNVDFTCIDVSNNFLPSAHQCGAFLLMPTLHWKKYLIDNEYEFNNSVDINTLLHEYLLIWARTYRQPGKFKFIKHFNSLDLLELVCKYIQDEPINRIDYE